MSKTYHILRFVFKLRLNERVHLLQLDVFLKYAFFPSNFTKTKSCISTHILKGAVPPFTGHHKLHLLCHVFLNHSKEETVL